MTEVNMHVTIQLDVRAEVPAFGSLDEIAAKLRERCVTAMDESYNTGAFDDLTNELAGLEAEVYVCAGDLDDLIEDALHTDNLDDGDMEPTFGKEGDDD